VEASTPFEVVIRPDKEEPLTLHKHDVKLYFLAKDKKAVVKTLEWGDQSRTLAPDHLKDRNNRKDVKARTYQHAMDAGKSVTWTTAEGEQVRGKVAWYGRYEVVLSLAKGPNVVMMRHAVDTVE
jgi:sRNA-binding regulator protein Hfq